MLVDDSAHVLYANLFAEEMFRYGDRELEGVPLASLSGGRPGAHHPWLAAKHLGTLRSRSANDDLQLTALRRTGERFPMELGLARTPSGESHCFLLTLVDLSARKAIESSLVNLTLELGERTTALEERTAELQQEAERRNEVEAELERTREEFRYLFQRNPLPMYLYSPSDLRMLEVNDAALQLYGYARNEFLAMTLRSIHPGDEQPRLSEVVGDANGAEFYTLRNWRQCNKRGRVFEVDTFSRGMGTGPGALRLVAVVDVTSRNAVEKQLRQAQKMEAIGQLTGGIAHDFNNLLTIVLGNLEMIVEQPELNTEVRSMAYEALASVRRGASLTRRLLAFSRQQPLEPRSVDMAHMVTDMTGLFRRSLGETIQVQCTLPPKLWPVSVDASQLENALLNLAVNARDAMPSGGVLGIEARNVTLTAADLAAHPEAVAGDYVQIAVMDSGVGMAREVLDHVLEPFFTTKPVGKGTGLGLSMVYGFARQSGGHLRITSEVGKGSTVKLLLPRQQGEARPVEPMPMLTGVMPRSASGETILLVEDDATIRRLVQRLLTMLGYRALVASDAQTALEVLSQHAPVDLLFTDVVLPNGRSGADLVVEAQRMQPGLRVLYMSGYTRNALQNNAAVEENPSLLTKPFRKEDLARAVHRSLNA